MPILQPVQLTIHPEDFRDKAYGFVVESVLTEKAQVGILTVSVSAGYLLATSQNKAPGREQIIEHIQQSDGSWLAEAGVTLFASEDSLINGAITIRNSLAETVVLTVDIPSTALGKLEQTELALYQPRLTFAQTSPGKPSFLIFTVPQLPADAIVKLTTDTPEYFQLASDSRPTFLPDLTIAPLASGTSVHVRYSANKAGLHTGQLLIHSEYEKQTVALEGRSTGLLPTIKPISLRRSVRRQPTSKNRVRLFALVMACGLVGAGYLNRYQLFPALYPNAKVSQVSTQPDSALNIPASTNKPLVKTELTGEGAKQAEAQKKSKFSSKLLTREPSSVAPVITNDLDKPGIVTTEEAEIGNSAGRPSIDKERTSDQPTSQVIRPKSLTPTDQESDLEKELNQKP